MAMAVGVTSKDVLARFLRCNKAKQFYDDWSCDPRRKAVVPRLMQHVSRFANVVSTKEVTDLCRRIKANPRLHALGDISHDEGAIPQVRDWSPSFAFSHAFHFVMEDEGELLTFEDAIRHDSFRECVWNDVRDHVNTLLKRKGNTYKETELRRAVRWRIGLSYYALIKELYVMALLREEGFMVRQHPLADSLFRTDFWLEDTNVDLFLGNALFRVEGRNSGRKLSSRELWADAVPQFSHVVLTCPLDNKFGQVYLPLATPTIEKFSRSLAQLRSGRAT